MNVERAAGADLWTLGVILGLALITVVTRSFFFLFERHFALPGWVERGLRYAPIAALAAVVAPEIVLLQGDFTVPWRDARVWGAAAGVLAYVARRSVLLTLGAGMAVYLPLRLGLGW